MFVSQITDGAETSNLLVILIMSLEKMWDVYFIIGKLNTVNSDISLIKYFNHWNE